MSAPIEAGASKCDCGAAYDKRSAIHTFECASGLGWVAPSTSPSDGDPAPARRVDQHLLGGPT